MPRLKMAQGASVRGLIADELEVALGQIDLEYAPPTGHSNAVRGTLKLLAKASATARVMLVAAAARRWGVDARSCDAYEGEVVHAPTWRKLNYGELAIDAAYMPVPKEITLKEPWVAGARI